MVQALTDSTFQSFLSENPVALIDFTATWCGPCQLLKPTIEELATQYAGKAGVAMVDIDENSSIAGQFSISAVPTILVFKGGQVVEQLIGMNPKKKYAEILDRELSN